MSDKNKNKESTSNSDNESEDDEIKKLKESLKISNNELSKIKDELKKSEEKNSEYISHIQRLQADFENYKKQTEKQKTEIIEYANEKLILKILDVYEDFDRALINSKNDDNFKEGVELTHKKFQSILEKEGLNSIETNNKKFDPFKHEAMMSEANDDYENGMIIEELAKGYTLKDKVLKYSMVKVCKK